MRISGFSRRGKLEPLPAAVVCIVFFLGMGLSLMWDLSRGEKDRLAMGIPLAVIGVWMGYTALDWLWSAYVDGRAVYVKKGRLHVNTLLARSMRVEDIRAVGPGEGVTGSGRRFPSVQIHLASGAPCHIPTLMLEEHPDEVARRIRSLAGLRA